MTYQKYGVEVLYIKSEMEALLAIMRAHGIRSVLELGVYKGGSAVEFIAVAQDIVGVDIDTSLAKSYPGTLLKFDSTSEATASYISTYGPVHIASYGPYGIFDMVHIDADHSYAATKRNCELYAPHCRRLVVFHDINNAEVHRAFVDSLKDKEHLEIRALGNLQPEWNGVGIVFM